MVEVMGVQEVTEMGIGWQEKVKEGRECIVEVRKEEDIEFGHTRKEGKGIKEGWKAC